MKSTHKARPKYHLSRDDYPLIVFSAYKELLEWCNTQESELREILSRISITSRLYYFIKEDLLGDKSKPYKIRKIAK